MTLVVVNPDPALIPQQGTPPAEGRYVVFVRCASYQVRDWLEPEIATWHGGRWHNYRAVFAWIGPLPLCKWGDYVQGLARHEIALAEAAKKPAQEYDL